jgi:hypothetical protein
MMVHTCHLRSYRQRQRDLVSTACLGYIMRPYLKKKMKKKRKGKGRGKGKGERGKGKGERGKGKERNHLMLTSGLCMCTHAYLHACMHLHKEKHMYTYNIYRNINNLMSSNYI